MIFGDIPLSEAAGAILAHTTKLPGLVIQKGSVLDQAHLKALAAAGFSAITGARLEPGDVGENEAATRLAQCLVGDGVRRLRAGTGRANLVAARAGLWRVDAALLAQLNGIDEGLTVACLADATPVRAGDMVATIKIIPFAVGGDVLARAESLAQGRSLVRLIYYRALRVALCLSTRPGLKRSVIDSTIEVTRQRVEGLGGVMLPPVVVAHQEPAIRAAFTAALADRAELLLFTGASAVVDRADVGPAALVAAGGVIDHFGMPVDPGNLICLGHVGPVPAVILPGCARSPKLNGIDLVLRLIFAGEPVGRREIAAMGAGGLLTEFAARPAPRAGKRAGRPRIAAIVLAAGLSRRMSPYNKLLAVDKDGWAMVARVVASCIDSMADEVVVVLGHQAAAVEQAARRGAQPDKLRFVVAPGYALGLAESLKAGLAAISATMGAALICLGDMPLLTPALLNEVMAAYQPAEGRTLIAPRAGGRLGNPVLWDRAYFKEIFALRGDSGAKAVLERHSDAVFVLDMPGEAVLTDFDTPESLHGFAPVDADQPLSAALGGI